MDSDALISFNDLRLLPEEENAFLSQLLTEKDDFGRLDEESRYAVVNAVRDQCGGHIFARQVSLDKLDGYARLPQNQNCKATNIHSTHWENACKLVFPTKLQMKQWKEPLMECSSVHPETHQVVMTL